MRCPPRHDLMTRSTVIASEASSSRITLGSSILKCLGLYIITTFIHASPSFRIVIAGLTRNLLAKKYHSPRHDSNYKPHRHSRKFLAGIQCAKRIQPSSLHPLRNKRYRVCWIPDKSVSGMTEIFLMPHKPVGRNKYFLQIAPYELAYLLCFNL